jgi:glutaredoxin
VTDQITLYSVPGCPHCAEARAWLCERGLAFSEVDVRVRGPVLHQALVHAGRPVVPVIEVGRQVLVGFDPERLAEIIALARSGD